MSKRNGNYVHIQAWFDSGNDADKPVADAYKQLFARAKANGYGAKIVVREAILLLAKQEIAEFDYERAQTEGRSADISDVIAAFQESAEREREANRAMLDGIIEQIAALASSGGMAQVGEVRDRAMASLDERYDQIAASFAAGYDEYEVEDS